MIEPEGHVPSRFSHIRQTRWFCLHPTEVPVRESGIPRDAPAPSSPRIVGLLGYEFDPVILGADQQILPESASCQT